MYFYCLGIACKPYHTDLCSFREGRARCYAVSYPNEHLHSIDGKYDLSKVYFNSLHCYLAIKDTYEILQNASISQADSPSGSNLNALGFYLLVSLFFIIATMIEFAYILLVCRVTGEVANYEIAGMLKLIQSKSNGRLELKSSIEINNIQKQSSPATHFNDNRESTNWKLQPNTKCYLNPNIIDFVSFFVFLFSYVLFNCFYVFYYIWNCSVVIVSISSGIWIVGCLEWWFLIILVLVWDKHPKIVDIFMVISVFVNRTWMHEYHIIFTNRPWYIPLSTKWYRIHIKRATLVWKMEFKNLFLMSLYMTWHIFM